MRTFEEIKASMKNRKPTIFSEIAENELRYNKGVTSTTTMRTFEEILESIKDIDLMFDDELINKFINKKDEHSTANLYNLLIAGSLNEDDICELSSDDVRNIVDYVNVRYDIDLKVVGCKVIWNS